MGIVLLEGGDVLCEEKIGISDRLTHEEATLARLAKIKDQLRLRDQRSSYLKHLNHLAEEFVPGRAYFLNEECVLQSWIGIFYNSYVRVLLATTPDIFTLFPALLIVADIIDKNRTRS